jgi:arylsulfatase A-like enzyme
LAEILSPFKQWPLGSGFEDFYGVVGAETNQWYPALYDGVTPIEPDKTPEEGYHLTEDLADKASPGITWVSQQKSLMPDKPFFMYFAPDATHAPHHPPKEWSDKYKGRFDKGWDAIRETLAKRRLPLERHAAIRFSDLCRAPHVATRKAPTLSALRRTLSE